ncbi:hypothetical protein F52700_13625 [Fusarium sp. NRRL 52700]|nr:hypothetical protein F52700_13625 [Fusarium sp. NRRL 52700]
MLRHKQAAGDDTGKRQIELWLEPKQQTEPMFANLFVVGTAFSNMNDQAEADRLMLVSDDNEKSKSSLQHHTEHLTSKHKANIDRHQKTFTALFQLSSQDFCSFQESAGSVPSSRTDSHLPSESNMWFLFALSLLLSVTSAAQIIITFTLDVRNSTSSLIVQHKNGGIVTGRCGRTINAKVPIDFSQVMANTPLPSVGNYIKGGSSHIPATRGNFTIGNDTYAVQPDPVFSGGPSCLTDLDPVNHYISIYCTDLYWDYADVIDEKIESDCIGSLPMQKGKVTYTKKELKGFYKWASKAWKKYYLFTTKIDLIGAWIYNTKKRPNLDGNGWPHQRYFYKQVSETVQCGNNETCTVTRDKGVTMAYGATGTAIPVFASFGFTVSESIVSGNGYCCHGTTGQKVCIWHKVAYTSYTVRMPARRKIFPWNKTHSKKHNEQISIAAPNNYNGGGGFLCRYDDECRTDAFEYWDCNGEQNEGYYQYCPPPGHPPSLDPTKGVHLPQWFEEVAAKAAWKQKEKDIKAKGGKKAWKASEKERKKHEGVLKAQYKAWKEGARVQQDIEKKREEDVTEQAKKDGRQIDKTHF